MSESTKRPTIRRRLLTGIYDSWRGPVLDVGSGPDHPEYDWPARVREMGGPALARYRWERDSGDAHDLAGVPDERFPTVYASHVLEHLERPLDALSSWVRVCQRGGLVFVAVPHRRLYECGKEAPPSFWSGEHLWFFEPDRHRSERVLGLAELLTEDLPAVLAFADREVRLEYLATCDWDYRRIGNAHPQGEYQIEAALRRVR